MINNAANVSFNTAFSDFALNSRDKNFFVTKKYEPPKKEDKHNNRLAMTIGVGALVLGFGVLWLMRGPKGQNKILSKMKEFLEKRIVKSKTGDTVSQFYLCALNKVNSFIEKSESINNFTSLKDAGFKKIMGWHKFTEKIHNKISKMFEKASRETVVTSWHNTKHKMNKTFSKFEKLDEQILTQQADKAVTINGVTKKAREWVEILKNQRGDITSILEENTAKNKLITRYKKIKNATKDLADLTLTSFKDWRKKELYQTFVADRAIIKDKAELFDEMNIFREQISFNRQHKLDIAKDLIKKVENLAGSKDFNVIKQISQLKADLKKGISDEKLIAGIDELNAALKVDAKSEISVMLEKAKGFLNNKNQGKMEDMMNIYEKLLPPKDFAKLEKESTAFVRALDKSINTESVQFFDKVRDLQIGSAPTDVLSIIAATGLIGTGLLKADDRDERISVTLKAGIPVLGALATSLYCTARLISGSKSMIIGLVSGKLLNIIGDKVDKFRKDIKEKSASAKVGTNGL